jgi:hypothetical protein
VNPQGGVIERQGHAIIAMGHQRLVDLPDEPDEARTSDAQWNPEEIYRPG